MAQTAPPRPTIEVWYDGDCALCRTSRDWCIARDSSTRIDFRDFRDSPDDELPVSRPLAESSMWVRQVDGRLFGGFEGWRRILSELPRWRWLSAVTGAPPIRWFGPLLYGGVSRLRHRIGRRRRGPA